MPALAYLRNYQDERIVSKKCETSDYFTRHARGMGKDRPDSWREVCAELEANFPSRAMDYEMRPAT
jgi:hypothetical protein